MSKRTGGGRLVAFLAASAVLTSGCVGSVDAGELPGLYRSKETGGEVRLGSDGTFSATGVATGIVPGRADFRGRWEFVDSPSSRDFVHLAIEDGGLGRIGGVQLYPSGRASVEFHADPDGPPSLVLTKVTTP
ncbi:hypothetical protein ACFQU9_30405 [Actinomadura namibiensis]|uniref:Uncharacterized protein n=1 Tax=Actinomadura namibiensis TaxID=182080 RepID=A0A7W3LJ73_ACTNM|nr:hypothetical protein [Actinomadura namibiensis]MBA8949055.1 hypothetical protein [Actinomadura namibiensis]